jgi:glycosyltransferase involved in cell wall biosynthesis
MNSKVVCHLTTVHSPEDVRIFVRECKSIAELTDYTVVLAAYENNKSDGQIVSYNLGKRPKTRLVRILKSQISAIRAFRKIEADLWHIHDPELLPAACLMAFSGVSILWDAHEDYHLQFSKNSRYRNYMNPILSEVLGVLVRRMLKIIDERAIGVITPTNFISKKYLNSRSTVVGNEARGDEFRDSEPKFANNLALFIGRADATACFKQVVQAIAHYPQLNLGVAGEKPSEKEWDEAFLVLGNRLSYLGWLNRSELAKVISDSILGFVTYQDLPSYQSISPNKLYEFAASGLPMIVTPNESSRRWVSEGLGCEMTKGHEVNDFCREIEKIISSEDSWTHLSQKSRLWFEKFGSWGISEKNLINLYLQIAPLLK